MYNKGIKCIFSNIHDTSLFKNVSSSHKCIIKVKPHFINKKILEEGPDSEDLKIEVAHCNKKTNEIISEHVNCKF